jgi:hypothetical protein
VTSFDSGNGRDPIDPDFAGLFRPEDAPAPQDTAQPVVDDEPHFEPIVDPVLDPRQEDAAAAEPAPEPSTERDDAPAEAAPGGPAVDTGRLFRSQGVTGHREAVLALSSDHFGRLRTLQRVNDDAPVLPDVGPIVVGGTASALPPADVPASAAAPEGEPMTRRERRQAAKRDTVGRRARNITGGAVYLIVLGVTVLVGFANALLADGDIGWPTGIALVASSVYAALTVRREDDAVAIIVPPIAFLLVAVTAGQLFLGSTEGSLLNRAVVVFFTLADNWFWIIGATAAALVIVLVRRRRA